MKYLIVLERAPSNWCAYAPDVWGCVATGDTRDDVTQSMREALAFHFEGTREDKLPIPRPGTWSSLVRADIPASDSVAAEVHDVRFPVVLEHDDEGWGAYVPDLPGCVAVGTSRAEVEELIRGAVAMHIRGMLRDGDPIPPPGTWTAVVDVKVPAEALEPAS